MQVGQKFLKLPRAILFDWDDCLVTQAGLIGEMTDLALKKFLSAGEYEQHKNEEIISGQSMKRVFPRIFGQERWLEVKNYYYECFNNYHLDRLQLLPNAESVLTLCRDNTEFLGLVSNKKGDFLRKEVAALGLDHYFQTIIGADDASDDKPSRAPVDLALQPFSPFQDIREQQKNFQDDLWFIGDRKTDVLTAKACGCISVFVGQFNDEIKALKPDAAFTNLEQFKTFFASCKLLNQHAPEIPMTATKTFGDMSPRRYTRIENLDSSHEKLSFMIMDAQKQPESLGPFIEIQQHLEQLGYSVPKIYGQDLNHQLLLLEDFQDRAFQDLLKPGADDTHPNEKQCYELAIDLLIDLHQKPVEVSAPQTIQPYDQSIYLKKLMPYLIEYRAYKQKPPFSEDEQQTFLNLWQQLIQQAQNLPQTLVLRDYNRRNIFFLEDRQGLNQCGLIDFQDAVRGPITEDLLSLLTSSRIPMDQDLRQHLIKRYLQAFPNLNLQDFWASWHILTTHRLLRLLGLYASHTAHDQNQEVKQYIPRVEKMLEASLQNNDLVNSEEWLALTEWLNRKW